MNVRELIEELSNHDHDMEVITFDGYAEEFYPIKDSRIVMVGETDAGLLDVFDDDTPDGQYKVTYKALVI